MWDSNFPVIRMQVFGHRGSPGFPRYGENTRTSFLKALQAGSSGFEFDVRRCGDGNLVVLHDATLERTTNGAGPVAALSYEQLRRFDAGHGDSIPLLTDILNEFGTKTILHIELKDAGLSQDVAKMLRARGLLKHVVISGFDADDNEPEASSTWIQLGEMAPEIPIALLATRRKIERIGAEGFVQAALQLGALAIHPPRDTANRDMIRLAHDAKLSVRIWSVNDSAEARRWRDLGADAIFSDTPERCIHALKRFQPPEDIQ
jgi:glycerophosphoryl diester phosphodiesterase